MFTSRNQAFDEYDPDTANLTSDFSNFEDPVPILSWSWNQSKLGGHEIPKSDILATLVHAVFATGHSLDSGGLLRKLNKEIAGGIL